MIFILTLSIFVQAEERIISVKKIPIKLTLSKENVICSSAGYGNEFLKILIPELAKHSIMEHRNIGVEAPCLGAGRCLEDKSQDFLKKVHEFGPIRKKVMMSIILKKHYNFNVSKKVVSFR